MSNTSNTHRQQRRHRLVSLLMLVMLLLGGRSPIVPHLGNSAAQPLCLDGKIWSDEEQSCVNLQEEEPAEEPQPTEPPAEVVETPTEVPAGDDGQVGDDEAIDDQADEGNQTPEGPMDDGEGDTRVGDAPVGFTMYSMACPSGFDPRTADVDTQRGTCTTWVGDVLFSLTVNGDVVGAKTSPEGPGGAQFVSSAAGDFAVSQSVPPGYTGPAAIVCWRSGDSYDSVTTYTFTNDGGSFLLADVQPGENWYCTSYLAAQPNAEIMVYVFGCPENYDIYTKGPDELKADCTSQFEGTEFILEHPTDGISHAYTSSFSTASFTNIAPGQVRLREVMPNGYGVPVVFCQVRGPDGQTTKQYDKYNVSNNASIGLGMDQLEFVGCDFFQALGGQPVQGAIRLESELRPLARFAKEGIRDTGRYTR